VVAGLLVLGFGLGALAIASGPGGQTTYAGRVPVAAALTLSAGLGLALAGLMTGWRRPASPRAGKLALAAAITWFAPVWVAWSDGPGIWRSAAMLLTGLTFAFVLNLALVYPTGRAARMSRVLVSVVYAETLLAAALLALFRDPYLDRSCWSNCSVNSFLVSSHPSLVHGVETVDRWFTVAAGLALMAIVSARLANSSPPARRRLAPVELPAVAFVLAAAARAIALQAIAVENPFNTALFTIFLAASGSLILLAAGMLWSVARQRTTRRAVARIATSLGEAPAPGSVQSALAQALQDPKLTIAYATPNADRYVDAGGHSVPAPTTSSGRTITRLRRTGATIGLIAHSGAVAELETQLGPAILLGLENERLRAQTLARLNELRGSRARIVEREDRERRRMERDLHDGAQQRLLALSYEIRLAHAAAHSNGEGAAEVTLAHAIEQTANALDDLRDLAHGIYPAILTDAGLEPALHTLADAAPIAVEVHAPPERYAHTVEAAVYFAVAEAVDDAARRHASHVQVRVERDAGRIIATITDDGSESAAPLASVTDRVGAIGGAAWAQSTSRRLEIVCE
jgi:signal transduction histidine kinase